MSFLLSPCIGLLLFMAQVCFGDGSRALNIPVIATQPHNCLYAKKTYGPYCWYILRNNHQINGGMRLLANGTNLPNFASLEISAILKGGRPVQVGVWAQGYTAYDLKLTGGIITAFNFYIPPFSQELGRPIKGGWEINLPTMVQISTEIPDIGRISDEDHPNATAIVNANGNARLEISSEMVTSYYNMTSKCKVAILMSSEDLVTWHYEAYLTLDVGGTRGGYSVHYTNDDLVIFSGTLK
ncbi:hypothetical protein FOL47_006550 [Perkinsus chesapeaki]|uniref:Uncharacterized protein n=1 Tax=Perkinsus chesapeaki TaxID=330153 RepID=A0A7J6LRV9_PERCH|nr:hypothetical protein FOL47_006550 [Perkinsus chesapeaki]